MPEDDRQDGKCQQQMVPHGLWGAGLEWLGVRLAFLGGLLSLLWVLARVIPKPSRATYPCMRVATPMASGFVVGLAGLLGSMFAVRELRRRLRRPRSLAVAMGCGIAVCAVWLSIIGIPQWKVAAWGGLTEASLGPPNDPLGIARGANPGRVVWVHDPLATDWAGPGSSEYWWQGNHTVQARVDEMVSRGLRWLAGKPTDAEAWSAIFRHFNQERGKGIVGYMPGEKIAIKVNLTTCNASWGGGTVNPLTGEKTAFLDKADTSMHVMLALLRQLIYGVGVEPSDISIGDTLARFPNQWRDYLAVEFPGVRYLDHYGTLPGRTAVAFSTTPFYWSTSAAAGKEQDFLEASFAGAAYIINVPVLKGHSAGITICSKNLYGSMARGPEGQAWGGYGDYYNLHDNLAASSEASGRPGVGYYRPQVDLMGHHELGGKTVLHLVDALYCGYYWEGTPYRWDMAPFNHDWPSSLFLSMDPVAIDSVGYDFLDEEWPDVVSGGTGAPGSLEGAAEDYLHEAALADGPPSGTTYDPEGDGSALDSLGVHEHWNNAVDKLYSRNLGIGDGIELVSGEPLPSWDLTVTSAPIAAVAIGGSHPGSTPYLELAADSALVTLTAPEAVVSGGTTYGFRHWVLDGAGQPEGQPTIQFDASADHSAAAVFAASQATVSAGLNCAPSSGTLPFVTNLTVTLTNNHPGQSRRIAARVDVHLAGGSSVSNWRSGYTTVSPAGSYLTSWNQQFPASSALIGVNLFTLQAEDVTPSPYNQPPYPPSGDTAGDACLVTGIRP